ncbi:MAG TPA: oligopeptide:H+ symporter [Phycicoccus sp.]|jgi:POT family proton-dependent oligopeptide transporter|nr:oligopeptide:H+ symporter [Phycicoccus sp.]HQK30451.1 oligopeptide:H+ symporter [Phycicoccus sp.]
MTAQLSPEPVTEQPERPAGGMFGGHPRALLPIWGVAMWDFVSFWGMQAILMMYMIMGLGIAKPTAMGVMGAYMGLGFLVTVLAGLVSDRLLGQERTLLWSAILVMLGHICLSLIPGIPGLVAGLVGVGLGSGGIKAAGVSTLGTFYAEGDERRYAGFSLFYFGLNLGAFAGPIVTGLVQGKWGFHAGFMTAGVGMALGLVMYFALRKDVRTPETMTVKNPLGPNETWKPVAVLVGIVAVASVLWMTGLLNPGNLSTWVAITAATLAVAYFSRILTSARTSDVEKSRLKAYIPLWVSSVLFWSLFMQIFTVLPVYAEGRVDFDIFGWTMPLAWIFSINPVWVIIMATVFAWLWARLDDRAPVAALKFAIALVVLGVAYLCFIPFAGGGKGTVPLLAIVGILFLFSVGELLISPVGMALVTKLAPQNWKTQTVGVFFLSPAIGSALAGVIGQRYNPDNEVVYFGFLGVAAIVVGLLIAGAAKTLTRLMGGVR